MNRPRGDSLHLRLRHCTLGAHTSPPQGLGMAQLSVRQRQIHVGKRCLNSWAAERKPLRPGRKGWPWSVKGRLWRGEVVEPDLTGQCLWSPTFSAAFFARD